MKQIGFFRGSRLIAAKDLRIEWRTWDTLSSTVIFSLIVLVIFSFAFDLGGSQQINAETLLPGVFWTVIAFAAVVILTRSIQLERAGETLSALFLAPLDRGAIFAGKTLANLLKLTLLQWILLALSVVFFNHDPAGSLSALGLVLLVHGIGLAELGTLFAGVTSRVGRGEALLTVLLFPAASPLLISAVKCTAAVIEGHPLSSVSHWLMISAGLDALYLFVGLLTFEFVLEE